MKNKTLAEKLIDLHEMARVGKYGDLDFRVYTEPLLNPSFHLVHKDFEIVLQIKDLKILEIKRSTSKYNFKKNTLPSNPILKKVLSFMKTKTKSEIFKEGTTYKQVLIHEWNMNNENQISSSYIKWPTDK